MEALGIAAVLELNRQWRVKVKQVWRTSQAVEAAAAAAATASVSVDRRLALPDHLYIFSSALRPTAAPAAFLAGAAGENSRSAAPAARPIHTHQVVDVWAAWWWVRSGIGCRSRCKQTPVSGSLRGVADALNWVRFVEPSSSSWLWWWPVATRLSRQRTACCCSWRLGFHWCGQSLCNRWITVHRIKWWCM